MLPAEIANNRKVVVVKEFVTIAEAALLVAWVNANHDNLRVDGFGSGMRPVEELPNPPALIVELQDRAKTFVGALGASWVGAVTGCKFLVAKQVVGARAVKSPYPGEEGRHVRFTVILSQAESGGNVVLDGEETVLPERCAWICIAGDNKITMTEIGGAKPKIICSFGFQEKQGDVLLDTKKDWDSLLIAKGL